MGAVFDVEKKRQRRYYGFRARTFKWDSENAGG